MNGTVPPERNPAPVEELRRQLTALKAEVTSQQWLLDALESQSAQYRALFELMPESVVLLDSKGFIRDANPYFCRAMGYAREELVGQHVTQVSREKPEVIERNILKMISGETLQHEVLNVRKDGAVRFTEWREAAVTLPDGSMNILAVSNDVTERRYVEQAKLELERQVLDAQKADEADVLSEFSYDYNNLLAVLLSNIESAISDVPAGSAARSMLTDALLAGKQVAEMTRQMPENSASGRFVISELDLSKLARDLSELLKVSIPVSVRLDMALALDLPLIQANAAQLQQVVMNLVANAAEAVGGKPGVIAIETRLRECDASALLATRTGNRPQPGRYVALEIKHPNSTDENGRPFDPFGASDISARALGMSAVVAIVERHHGAITVSSEPGKGAVISVLFPVVPTVARVTSEKDSRRLASNV